MKRNIIISFIIGLFLTAGCESLPIGNAFLQKAPGVTVTQDTIFGSIELAQRFLWGAYRTLPYLVNTNAQSASNGQSSAKGAKMSNDLLEDMTNLSQTYLNWGGAFTIYYSGQYTSATENSGATKYRLSRDLPYDGIRRSLIFIENIDRVPDVDPALARQLKAEARMIMAIHYSDLFRHYGGIPWVTHSYNITDDMSSFPRLTAQLTCDSIVALCERAATDLPWVQVNLAEWDGRMTKAGAMGLKARILLFNASPLFNSSTPYLDGAASQAKLTWHGSYDANRWNKAMVAAHDLILQCEAGTDYKIYHKAGNSLRQDFQDAYYQRGTGETLISIRDRFRSTTGGSWDYCFYWSSNGWGSGCPTDDYVKMFPMASGLPITDPTSGYDSTKPYLNRDPRLYETILTNGDVFKGRTAELWLGGRERLTEAGTQAGSGYSLRKFILDGNTATSYGSIVHSPFLRLPEIYLSYAEASNEVNNGPDAEAYRCVNIVRNRVGLGNLPSGLTKDQFREAVLLERALEFGWEDVHWFDLIRWKREADFKNRLHGMKCVRTGTSPNYVYTYTRVLLPLRYWQQVWSPKWYLSAFPVNEINKRYGLVQNPGWE